jgi:hypothetical protein
MPPPSSHRWCTAGLLLTGLLSSTCQAGQNDAQKKDTTPATPAGLNTPLSPGYTIPTVDISEDTGRQTLVDREPGQYLGHPTTALLDDGRTLVFFTLAGVFVLPMDATQKLVADESSEPKPTTA